MVAFVLDQEQNRFCLRFLLVCMLFCCVWTFSLAYCFFFSVAWIFLFVCLFGCVSIGCGCLDASV